MQAPWAVVPLHFLGKLRVLLTMHNPRSPGHGNGFSLGFHLMPSKVEPMSSRFHPSRHPAPDQPLCPQSVYYLIGINLRSASSPRTRSRHTHVRRPLKSCPQAADKQLGSPRLSDPSSQLDITCLWPMLLNKRTSTLFLLFNLAHRL